MIHLEKLGIINHTRTEGRNTFFKSNMNFSGYTGTLFHRAKDAEFVLADYIQREMAPTSTGGQ